MLCGEKTCLAFSGAVFTGAKKIEACPRLDSKTILRFSEPDGTGNRNEEMLESYLKSLTNQAVKLDFEKTAKRIGAENVKDVLTLRVLGKSFGLNKEGRFLTDLHIIPWVIIPLLEYICHCKGCEVENEWISYREIPGGREKYNLFKKRGEEVLKRLGDQYTDFFGDIVQMFDGKRVAEQFQSDISVVLHPLPLVPVMICYWQPEEGMESKLNLYFDKSVGENLGADQLFYLGTGFAQMLEKLSAHHGF